MAGPTLPPLLSPTLPKIKRVGPQLLSDELTGEDRAAQPKAGRLLTDDRDPWAHNAWDNVAWDEEQDKIAQEMVAKQAAVPVPLELQEECNGDPKAHWDTFYAHFKDGFFNDRQWLRTEFSELADVVKADAGPKRVVEIGCGPGNTLFPLFSANENPLLQLHGLDFSKEAVELVKKNPAFDPAHCHAQVWDLSSKEGLPSSVEAGSVDVGIMIFVLSALHPDEWPQAVENAWTMLKPGGVLLASLDADMAQLRFKKERYMQPNLYIRGDKTRVYFFERDELVNLFGPPTKPSALSPSLSTLTLTEPPSSSAEHSQSDIPHFDAQNGSTAEDPDSPAVFDERFRFELLHLGVDRRLLLNRKKQLKMYRIWLQGRWRKPLVA
ncbi:hypothetical protein P7C70_g4242, partial [Phenoliferia sp. Uapishka_3]